MGCEWTEATGEREKRRSGRGARGHSCKSEVCSNTERSCCWSGCLGRALHDHGLSNGMAGHVVCQLGRRVHSRLSDRKLTEWRELALLLPPGLFTWGGVAFVYRPWKRFSGPHPIPTRLTVIAQASGPSQPPVNLRPSALGTPPPETRRPILS